MYCGFGRLGRLSAIDGLNGNRRTEIFSISNCALHSFSNFPNMCYLNLARVPNLNYGEGGKKGGGNPYLINFIDLYQQPALELDSEKTELDSLSY